jgi:DNA-binding response OmpR family regulator
MPDANRNRVGGIMHVLLVGGYRPLLRALRQGLEEEGFTVHVAADGRLETRIIASAAYDAIVLDLMKPGESLLPSWRRAGLKTPVLALTRPGDYASGADAWLAKPFALEDFFAHLRVLQGQPPRLA